MPRQCMFTCMRHDLSEAVHRPERFDCEIRLVFIGEMVGLLVRTCRAVGGLAETADHAV